MVGAINTLMLFPELNARLITFLRSLSSADWERQTVARQWKVKDVAAHLLDGNFRRIALHRDKWIVQPEREIKTYPDLVGYLNGLNADWVRAAKRLSPAIIIELLERTNAQVLPLFEALDPDAKAVFSVAWAGESSSSNWFDIAREYTERWLHQQQMRDALGDRGILTRELYHPFLDIFMRAWPVTMGGIGMRNVALKASITGEGGGDWYLVNSGTSAWTVSIHPPAAQPIVAETVIDGSAAWKLFSKSIRKEDMEAGFSISGNRLLGEKILDMISVMA